MLGLHVHVLTRWLPPLHGRLYILACTCNGDCLCIVLTLVCVQHLLIGSVQSLSLSEISLHKRNQLTEKRIVGHTATNVTAELVLCFTLCVCVCVCMRVCVWVWVCLQLYS